MDKLLVAPKRQLFLQPRTFFVLESRTPTLFGKAVGSADCLECEDGHAAPINLVAVTLQHPAVLTHPQHIMSISLVDGYDSYSSSDDQQHDEKIIAKESNSPLHNQKRCETLEESDNNSKSSPTTSKLEEGSTHGNGVTFKNMAPSASSGEGIPLELARELLRAGHDPHSVNLIDVDATTTLHDQKASQRSAPAMRTSANRFSQRISKSRNVSQSARRRNQITALAADALAVQATRDANPVHRMQRQPRKPEF